MDGAAGAVADQRLGFFHRLVPVGGVVRALADPAQGDHFGQLVLAQVLEGRAQFLLDAVVDRIVQDRQRFLVGVVDIVGGFVAVIVGRRLRLIFAGAQDDPAQRVEGSQ